MKPNCKPDPGKVRELFVAAVGKVAPEMRDAFLRDAASGDEYKGVISYSDHKKVGDLTLPH